MLYDNQCRASYFQNEIYYILLVTFILKLWITLKKLRLSMSNILLITLLSSYF